MRGRMMGKHCKLYDENVVRNIMISTGLSVFEYLKLNREVDAGEICEFVELNAEGIIDNTIEDMNSVADTPPEEDVDRRPTGTDES
mgnify:CR=1 FL=1